MCAVDSRQTGSREWDSAAYERVSAPQFSWGTKVLDRVRIHGNETVLDAGCGTGKLTRQLLELLPQGRVVAIDLSQNMLDAARRNLAQEFGPRVEFIAADLQELPFHESFDGIFSTAAFHWVPDHGRLFRGLFNALKPGGWLVAQCGGAGNLDRFLGRVMSLIQEPPFREYLGSFPNPWIFSNAESAKQRLEAAGFTNVEASLEPAPTRFSSAEQYCEFISKVILHRHLDAFPDKTLCEDLLRFLAVEASRDNPPWELDYWRLNLDGKKPVP